MHFFGPVPSQAIIKLLRTAQESFDTLEIGLNKAVQSFFNKAIIGVTRRGTLTIGFG